MLRRIPSRHNSVVQLFCIPNAGHGPAAFRGWSERLLPEIETIVVELPGRESRFHETPYKSMGVLVADLAEAVLDCLKEGQPFAFFGNSMGSIIAFETLKEIWRCAHREALHLFVSASPAPHCEPLLPPIGHLEDRELIRAVDARYGGIPAPVMADEEFLRAVLPTLRADICLLEAYRRQPPEPLGCPITAFGGVYDVTVTQEQVKAWCEHTSGAFECFFLDEGHLYLQRARDLLIGHLRSALLVPAAAEGRLA